MTNRGVVALLVLSGLFLFACDPDPTDRCIFNHMIGEFETDPDIVPPGDNLTVVVRVSLIGEGCQEPLEGATIEIFSSRNQRGEIIDIIEQPHSPTNQNGRAQAHLRMTTSGTATITATADGAFLCESWANGECVPLTATVAFYEVCTDNETDCGGVCVDPTSDPDHCGGCSQACTLDNAAVECVDSTCLIGECDQDYDNCDDDESNGCETDLLTDNNNCNECGNRCRADQACRDGDCQPATPCEELGLTNCGGQCVNTDLDDRHCGACGNMCGDWNCCHDGQCYGCGCYPPNIICSTDCINPMTSNAHCGRCDNPCDVAAGYVCLEGVCGCLPGLADCDSDPGNGCEIDLLSDPDNCNACGMVCVPSFSCCFDCRCIGGICNCPSCFGDCDGDPANGEETPLCTDDNNCGNCGNACDTDLTCCYGECVDLETDEENCGICGYGCDPGVPCTGGMCPEDGPDHVEVTCPENVLPGGATMQCTAMLHHIWMPPWDVTNQATWHQEQEINSGGNCTGGDTDATCGVVYSLDAGLVTMTDNSSLAGDRENIWAEHLGLTSNYWSIGQAP